MQSLSNIFYRLVAANGVGIGSWDQISSGLTFSKNWTTAESVKTNIVTLLNVAIGLGGLVAVAVLVYGAYMFITANGDEDKVTQGQAAITNAIIGLVVIFLTGLIIQFVAKNILGL